MCLPSCEATPRLAALSAGWLHAGQWTEQAGEGGGSGKVQLGGQVLSLPAKPRSEPQGGLGCSVVLRIHLNSCD